MLTLQLTTHSLSMNIPQQYPSNISCWLSHLLFVFYQCLSMFSSRWFCLDLRDSGLVWVSFLGCAKVWYSIVEDYMWVAAGIKLILKGDIYFSHLSFKCLCQLFILLHVQFLLICIKLQNIITRSMLLGEEIMFFCKLTIYCNYIFTL